MNSPLVTFCIIDDRRWPYYHYESKSLDLFKLPFYLIMRMYYFGQIQINIKITLFFYSYIFRPSKGQLILKGVLMSLISSKKRTKEFDFTTMIPQIDLFSFVFWRKSKTPKKTFRNYLTFRA